MTPRLLVFARSPVAGRAKTRLIPLLGAEGAARLHADLVCDTLARASAAVPGGVELWGTGDDPQERLARWAAEGHIPLYWQSGADLGARMATALGAASARGQPVIVVGSDCPALSSAMIAEAIARLASTDAVLVPAEDGGYVLLGMHEVDAGVFRDIAWGTPQVLAQTRARLVACGWRWQELDPVSDVDVPADLPALEGLGDVWRERLQALVAGP